MREDYGGGVRRRERGEGGEGGEEKEEKEEGGTVTARLG